MKYVIKPNLGDKVNYVSEEITNCENNLITAKKEKEFKIHCEEIATIINSYDSKKTLQEYFFLKIDTYRNSKPRIAKITPLKAKSWTNSTQRQRNSPS